MFDARRAEAGVRPVRIALLGGILCWAVAAVAADAPPPSSSVSLPEPTAARADQAGGGGNKLLDLDVDQLARTPVVVPSTPLSMDAPVTSVSKEQSTVGYSAAAVFVITQEMIRRSGATSIPEALRMAPGLEVAKINSSTWAVTSRGFNRRYANKLLVLIDGRTVYNPVFQGVLWDTEDVLLEDVERIEVIRGPGGTLWGANAVNGVISVITKRAQDTQGAYVTAGGGTYEREQEAVRYGGQLSEDCYYRIYGKHFDRSPGFNPDGADDAWRQGRAGFRVDSNPGHSKSDTLTVQGDHYIGDTGDTEPWTITVPPYFREVIGNDHVTGQDLLARWTRVYDPDSDWRLQTYYSKYQRDGTYRFELVNTYDLDFQYRFRWNERHAIICGAGYRHIDSDVVGKDYFTFHLTPARRSTALTSQFVQDEIAVIEERLALTLGAKLEQNDFTGLEYEPSARLLWTPDRRHSAWGAISRAVHTPSLINDGASITSPPRFGNVFPRLLGNPGFRSEDLMAYEIGYRAQATERFSWDIAAFYNVYKNLEMVPVGSPFFEPLPPPPHLVLPMTFVNGPGVDTYGVELAGNWALSERWRIYSQYTVLQFYARNPSATFGGEDPRNQVYLRSAWDLSDDLEFDLMARYVDRLAAIDIPSYISMDVRLAWRPRKHLELAAVGQNLLQSHHLEFARTPQDVRTQVTEVPRGVYGTLTWRH